MSRRAAARVAIGTAILVALDVAVIALGTLVAYYARFEGRVPEPFASRIPLALGSALAVYLLLFALFGLYRLVLRYVGVDVVLRLGAATALGATVLVLADVVAPGAEGMRLVPAGVLFIQALLVLLGASAVRLAVRIATYVRARQTAGRRVLIVGAGSAGSLLLREVQQRPDLGLVPVGFLDDDPHLRGRSISGVSVIGTSADLRRLVQDRDVDEVLVALPSASSELVRRVLNDAAEAGVQTRIMPKIVIERGSVSLRDLRTVEVEDLLGRDPTPIDVAQVAETIAGKVVAVTGAAGSIGAELCRQILTLGPKRLLLIDIDETRLYELWLELQELALDVCVLCLCDVRDAARLDAVFSAERPQVVLHAAAYKHVPLLEAVPGEAVKTNVVGTQRVIEACERHGVERFVLISTDKAVAPSSVMGATKALAERAMLAAAARGSLLAVAVRFGNVLASRGSVVPIFEEQLRHGGPLTVTDAHATRYFMTIPEAARLVLQAQAIGETGDIFVLQMGEPVRILDLAHKMIALSGVPADIEFVGLRPGEKLHETLTEAHEALEPTTADKVLRVASAATGREDFAETLGALAEALESGDNERVLALVRPSAPGPERAT